MNYPILIAEELSLKSQQVSAVLEMLAEGATIPFIARYRKERTNGLDEEQLRNIEDRNNYLIILNDRKETILKSIEEQGKLTDELRTKIDACTKLQELEDLYLPYKPKRKTKGTVAKAKGLEPLALFILENPEFDGDFNLKLAEFINSELGVETIEEALQGAKDIIAEMISESAEVRKLTREYLLQESKVGSLRREDDSLKDVTNEKVKDKEKKEVYKIYYDFKIEAKKIKPYQLLAINRGEAEKFLKVTLDYDEDIIRMLVKKEYLQNKETAFDEIITDTVKDSCKRLIFPSVEKEVRNYFTEVAELHAIEMFANNLKQLLLQPPLSNKIILGIDPGFYSGCKVAVIDVTGKYLEGATIYPHPPQNKSGEAKNVLKKLIDKYKVDLVAMGNGTASRETEFLVAELISENKLECKYLIVNEAGASVYSASELAKREFPDLEASQRGNISIARRVLDPLSELVKIDARSIGVGLYQHDVDQKLLTKKLDDVVVSCVNYVGVDVNTASVPLLMCVSGLNKKLAENIVKHREKKGKFAKRTDILEVTGVGEKTFEQAAGFLKVPGGEFPLDNTFIHPESYEAASKLMKMFNLNLDSLKESMGLIDFFVQNKGLKKIAADINVGEPTLQDIIENLKKPGRDPREDIPLPILRSDILKMEDLKPNMKLKGTVRNVIDFGAFIDIGVKQDALLHISQISSTKFVKNPSEFLNVGDVVDVTILEVDINRKRISVTMKEN